MKLPPVKIGCYSSLMNDEELLRYSRQIMLPQVDIIGQEKLRQASVLIVGAGGLGSPAAMYLAAAGVGSISITDDDKVDLSNLQRQILHTSLDIDKEKTTSARETLTALNPYIEIICFSRRLTSIELEAQAGKADVVLDCSDNFATRFAVNSACMVTKTPLVSGAAIRFEGQVSVFYPGRDDSPCYNCLYPNIGETEERCAQTGVIAPITGIVGSIQALEALKAIMGIGQTLSGRVLLLDGLTMEWSTMQLRRNPSCPTCSI